jgi:hypothetical protein
MAGFFSCAAEQVNEVLSATPEIYVALGSIGTSTAYISGIRKHYEVFQ